MKKKRRLLLSDTFWGLAAALLVLLQFWWLPGEDGSAADSYSTTIDGKLGLYRTLSELFPNVERDALNAVPSSPATLVLVAPDRYPNEKEQMALYQFVYNGGNLLFAPSWMTPRPYDNEMRIVDDDHEVEIPSLGIRLEYRPPDKYVVIPGVLPVPTGPPVVTPSIPGPTDGSNDGTTPGTDAASKDSVADVPLPDSNSATPQASPDPLAVVPPGVAPATSTAAAPGNAVSSTDENENGLIGSEVQGHSSLVPDPVTYRTTSRLIVPQHLTSETLVESASGEVEAATWPMGSGRVVVCSSADLFSNRSMLFKATRRLAVRLVERCGAPVNEDGTEEPLPIVISEFFNASDAYQSTGILFSPTLRIGTLQLLLVAVLGIWMAFHRFGPAAEVTSVQRRSLTESAQAVGNLQYRLQDGGAVIRGYLEYIRSQLRRRHGSLLRLDQPDAIANRAGMDAAEVRAQLSAAERMAESSHLSSASAAEMLRWLSKLQQRLTGNRNMDSVKKV